MHWEAHGSQPPYGIEWSYDGAVLAVARKDKIQFHAPAGNEIGEIQTSGKGVVSIALAPDGQRFVTGSVDGDVGFWNRRTGLEFSRNAHRDWIRDVKWNTASDLIASGSRDGKIKLWNADGTERATLEGHHASAVSEIDWHPSGDSLVSVDASEVICRWSKDGKLVEKLRGPAGKVPLAIAWAPDGESYCVAGDGRRIVHLPEGDTTPDPIEGRNLHLTDIGWGPGGKRFATTGMDGVIRVSDSDLESSLFIQNPLPIKGLSWSSDGKQLATATGENVVVIWSVATRRKSNTLKPLGNHSPLHAIAWNSFTGELAVGSANGSATIWKLPNSSLPTKRTHAGSVNRTEWLPNTRLLVTAGDSADVQIAEPGNAGFALRAGGKSVRSLACSPNAKLIAAISDHRILDIWKLDGTRITSTTLGTVDQFETIDWSHDSKTLFAIRSDGRLVQLGTDGTLLRDVPMHLSKPASIAVRRNAHDALSTDIAGTIIKWSTETLEPEWVLVTMPEGESLQFSASGEFLKGDRELFERKFVYVIEDETGRRHLLTPSEFEHRRSLPGDFSVSDEHADRRFAQWVVDRGGIVTQMYDSNPRLDSVDAIATNEHSLRIDFSGRSDFTDADLATLHQIRPSLRLEFRLDGTSITSKGVQSLNGLNLFGLDISGTRVSDEAFDTATSFENLVLLDLSDTQVSSASFKYFSNFPKLKILSLANLKVDSDEFMELRHPRLTQLMMIGSVIENGKLDFLEGLPNLEWLGLSAGSSPFGDDSLKHTGTLSKLSHLTLTDTRCTNDGLDHLFGLQSLIELQIVESRISDEGLTKIIKNWPDLRGLSLDYSAITDDGLTQLTELKQLKTFAGSGCGRIGTKGFAAIAKVSDLDYLYLAETSLTDGDIQTLSALKSLKHLNIATTKISDDCVDTLIEFPSLKVLVIQGTAITAEGVTRLRAGLPNCEVRTD